MKISLQSGPPCEWKTITHFVLQKKYSKSHYSKRVFLPAVKYSKSSTIIQFRNEGKGRKISFFHTFAVGTNKTMRKDSWLWLKQFQQSAFFLMSWS